MTKIWQCTITSSAPLLGDSGVGLELIVVDLRTGQRSPANSVEGWLPPQLSSKKDGTVGWSRCGPIDVPDDMGEPGALLIRKVSTTKESVDYISDIILDSPTGVFAVPVKSWVAVKHGWRVAFAGPACLPKDTPAAVAEERALDLAELQGTPETRVQTRQGGDRIYWYQTYDDLGTSKMPRPALGNSKAIPFPRRMATNRPRLPDGSESPSSEPWLPFDEVFSFNKATGFRGDTLVGALVAVAVTLAEAGEQSNLTFLNLVPTALRGVARLVLGMLPIVEGPLDNYEDFQDVLKTFKLDADKSKAGFNALLPKHLFADPTPRHPSLWQLLPRPFKTTGGAWDFRLPRNVAQQANEKTAENRVGPIFMSATGEPTDGIRRSKPSDGAPAQPTAASIATRLGADLWREVVQSSGDVNDLLYFNVPRVLEGRPDAWHSDEEYGRQMVAGYHPCVITALRELPEALGSAIRGEHVNAELQGATLEQLVAEAAAGGKPRLYWVDYWLMSACWEEAEEARARDKSTDRVEHQGRALFYLRKDEAGADTALVPVAFELASPTTHGRHPDLPRTAGIVYARSQLLADDRTAPVWFLAKAIFKSIDFSVHEVYSHFVRAHACMEPFLIALRRNLSSLHPVFKLMIPHFRYTANINKNARSTLINAGGIIEKAWTPGEYALRLGAAVYGALWTFVGQALPDDLKARGMVDAEGRPWLDFPFATDGLDIWAALSQYFAAYLRLYYSNDEDVQEDSELQAWWHEVKTEGHPDLVKFGLRTEEEVWGFAGPIPSRDCLTHVLATIAWTCSGHHAAVNFGQYDYVSFILNTSGLVRKPMPEPGDAAYKELVEAPSSEAKERIIMRYLADPISAAMVIFTMQVLSSHADDEDTLDEPNPYLTDADAVKANREFMAAMKGLDAKVAARNTQPANWARCSLYGGPNAPLPYTLLAPSSGAGITMRGVPYSVSI